MDFLKVVNDENRYADNNGLALKYLDVLDQLKLRSMNVQLSVSAPIGNSVSPNLSDVSVIILITKKDETKQHGIL